MTDLVEYDSVTIVLRKTGGVGHRTVAVGTATTKSFGLAGDQRDYFLAHDNQGWTNQIEDEGVTWLPGHVPIDGTEAKALLTAFHLAHRIDQ